MLITIAFLFITAAAAGFLMEKIKLPALLGYLLTGLVFSPYMAESLNLKDSFYSFLHLSHAQIQSDQSSFLRTLALIIILYRAGLGLDKSGLKNNGAATTTLSFLPCLLEAGAVTALSHLLFKLPLVESALIGFVLAAVSPAVIVPMMLNLQKKKIGHDKKIPTMILASSTVDDIVAISGFGICLTFLLEGNNQTWQMLLARVPISIVTGAVIGFYIAKPLAVIFTKTRMHNLIKAGTLIAVALAFKEVEASNRIPFSYLIATMVTGVAMSFFDVKEAEDCGKAFFHIWKVAEIILFVLIGAMVNFRIAFDSGLIGMVILFAGLTARSLGVYLCTCKSGLSNKEIFFCIIAYIPKATVQAAIGGVALSMFLGGKIYLYEGLDTAELIISMAAMSILITAPLGAIGIRLGSKNLLTQPKEN